ncbi:MAG: glutathionylspermidine synthase family protein [Candidatus Kapaibacterium sp.]|jgi:glutathionylspermidine synthase
MQRKLTTPRPDWIQRVEALGFFYHSLGAMYWDESAYYSFAMPEILELEKTTATLHEMCLAAAQHIIDNKLYAKLGIDPRFIPLIEESWNNEDPAIYGRFDLQYDGRNPAKMLEYNADTPTSLLEASVVQWYWLQDFNAALDQFNSIHEKLIDYWRFLAPFLRPGKTIHYTGMLSCLEDHITLQYLRDTAEQADYKTFLLDITSIGWENEKKIWVDEENNPMTNIFKLYPWEWLVKEEFGAHLLEDTAKSFWIEPPFKMLLSNKGILPILWELYPDHPNLLPAYFSDDARKSEIADNCAIKPLLSREGANIDLISKGVHITTGGDYGSEGVIYQALAPLPNFSDNYPVIGSWMIGQEPAGMGIRESDTLITTNTSRFVPHVIE